MTASDPRSPAKARSTGQAPSLLPPAVRQALEHPGPFALGLDAWLAAACGETHPKGLAAAVRARQLELPATSGRGRALVRGRSSSFA